MGSRRNATIAALVPIPSLVFYFCFLSNRNPGSVSSTWDSICAWAAHHPLQLLNLIFFLNVNVLFWIISLIQNSTWLIDPYWTFLPVFIAHYFASHPASTANVFRSRVVLLLVWVWSIRLTHSYFRRENWAWGAREDWRFAEMRRAYKAHWWWISFFAVYVSQQIFLVGICLPIYAVHQSQLPWDVVDTGISLLCLLGITIAYFADTQLHVYVEQKKKKKLQGDAAAPPVLNRGVWYYSRHPNYFGEQLWWWSFALFSWRLGYAWTILGALVNTTCLAYVTVLVEKRMLTDESRAGAYRKYQKTTSVWIPWFKNGKSE